MAIPHLNGQEDHHEGGEPNTTRTKPKHTRTVARNVMLSSKWSDDTGQSAHARQHTADATAVARVEEFGRRCIQYSIEVLGNKLASKLSKMR